MTFEREGGGVKHLRKEFLQSLYCKREPRLKITLALKLNLNISILWFGGLKAVILSTAPMPGHLFCVFCLSNFLAAILNSDVIVQCRAQATAIA